MRINLRPDFMAVSLLTTAALAFAACKTTGSGSEVLASKKPPAITGSALTDGEDAVPNVDQAVLDQAWQIVQSLDFVPSWHTDSGCEKRAYMVGLELASNNIAAYQVWVTGKDGLSAKHLMPQTLPLNAKTVDWQFHTATALRVNDVTMVMDPLLGKQPLTLDAWLAALGITRDDLTSFGLSPFSTGIKNKIVGAGTTLAKFPTTSESDLTASCGAALSEISSTVDTKKLTPAQATTMADLRAKVPGIFGKLNTTLQASGFVIADPKSPFSEDACADAEGEADESDG